jgi:sugar fermentation stimulation protein A
MRFQTELVPARLIRRYKRFLADCQLEQTGQVVTAHCPNPGSMLGLAAPGTRIWLEPNSDPRKKLKHGWRLVDHEDGHFTGVDTSIPNRVIAEALANQAIPAVADYHHHRAEVRYAENSRIDFLLTGPGLPDLYLEIKSVTLCRTAGLAEFPDSVTARGAKHLGDLAQMVTQGHRAMMLYLVQRGDCERFALARDLDPAYGRAFDSALAAGVETLCLRTDISPEGVTVSSKPPIVM